MQKKLIQFTDELWASIAAAAGGAPRAPWLESQLWRLKAIRDAAKEIGAANPKRPMEGRGGDRRSNS